LKLQRLLLSYPSETVDFIVQNKFGSSLSKQEIDYMKIIHRLTPSQIHSLFQLKYIEKYLFIRNESLVKRVKIEVLNNEFIKVDDDKNLNSLYFNIVKHIPVSNREPLVNRILNLKFDYSPEKIRFYSFLSFDDCMKSIKDNLHNPDPYMRGEALNALTMWFVDCYCLYFY
jgi:hypothetical protein